MRTNDLRWLLIDAIENVKTELGIKEIYFDEANPRALYPHVVVSFSGIDTSDFYRRDYTVDLDVWTKDREKAMDIGDMLEDIFVNSNRPNDVILPTFFTQTRLFVDDPDKSIVHHVIRLQTQLYENK